MASEFGDVAARLSDTLYDARGKTSATELSAQVTGMMEGADFSVDSELTKAFRNSAASHDLLNDLVLVEFGAIDGLTATGKFEGNARLDLTEVQTAIDMGGGDIYMNTALSYLRDTLQSYPNPHGLSANEFKLLAAMQPASDPSATPVSGTDGSIDYYSFSGADDPIALLASAPSIAKEFDNLDTDGSGGVSVSELEAGYNSDNDAMRNAATLAFQRNLAWNADGSDREFTFDDVLVDARNSGLLPPEPVAAEPVSEVPPVETVTETSPESGTETGNVEADCTAILKNPESTTVQQLAAIKKLVDNGITTAIISDADGNPLNVRLEVVPIAGSDRTMVHMFAIDPTTGKESVVLRAINDGENWNKQRDQNGNEVEFVGTRWKNNNPGTIFGD